MIIGIGTDLCRIDRIEQTLARFGARFKERVFTPIEQRAAERRANPAEGYAKRFAAKEACAKALGTGLRMGVAWREMGVVNAPSGQPGLVLTGSAAARLSALTPPGYGTVVHLSLTDDRPFAQAFVVIEAYLLSSPVALPP